MSSDIMLCLQIFCDFFCLLVSPLSPQVVGNEEKTGCPIMAFRKDVKGMETDIERRAYRDKKSFVSNATGA